MDVQTQIDILTKNLEKFIQDHATGDYSREALFVAIAAQLNTVGKTLDKDRAERLWTLVQSKLGPVAETKLSVDDIKPVSIHPAIGVAKDDKTKTPHFLLGIECLVYGSKQELVLPMDLKSADHFVKESYKAIQYAIKEIQP